MGICILPLRCQSREFLLVAWNSFNICRIHSQVATKWIPICRFCCSAEQYPLAGLLLLSPQVAWPVSWLLLPPPLPGWNNEPMLAGLGVARNALGWEGVAAWHAQAVSPCTPIHFPPVHPQPSPLPFLVCHLSAARTIRRLHLLDLCVRVLCVSVIW